MSITVSRPWLGLALGAAVLTILMIVATATPGLAKTTVSVSFTGVDMSSTLKYGAFERCTETSGIPNPPENGCASWGEPSDCSDTPDGASPSDAEKARKVCEELKATRATLIMQTATTGLATILLVCMALGQIAPNKLTNSILIALLLLAVISGLATTGVWADFFKTVTDSTSSTTGVDVANTLFYGYAFVVISWICSIGLLAGSIVLHKRAGSGSTDATAYFRA